MDINSKWSKWVPLNPSRIILSMELALCLMATMVPETKAQVVRWAVRPDYSSIEQISADFYRAKKDGKVGLIRANGGEVVPVTADSITGFVNGEAVVMVLSKGNYRIKTIVHSNGQLSDVSFECYSSPFTYFNDDLMMVTDKKGKIGYIDIYGHKIVDFKYKIAHPFSEGLAMVSTKRKVDFPKQMGDVAASSDNSKVFYIDHRGAELLLPKEMGDISFGSSFSNGTAIVKAKDGLHYINKSGEVLPQSTDDAYNYLNDIYQLVPYPDHSTGGYTAIVDDEAPSIYNNHGLYGYMVDDDPITPAIFKQASHFTGNYAIVRSAEGGVGMVNFVDKPVYLDYRYTQEDAEQVEVLFAATVPSEFEYSTIRLDFNPEAGSKAKSFSLSPTSKENNGDEILYVFTTSCKRENYGVLLYADEIPIYFSSLNLYVAPPATPQKGSKKRGRKQDKKASDSEKVKEKDKEKEKDKVKDKEKATPAKVSISIKPSSVKANKNNSATVSITLTNSGGTKATVPVKVSGASCSTKSVTLAPGASKTIHATISNIQSQGTRTVSVSAGSFGSSSVKINVRPFFEEF